MRSLRAFALPRFAAIRRSQRAVGELGVRSDSKKLLRHDHLHWNSRRSEYFAAVSVCTFAPRASGSITEQEFQNYGIHAQQQLGIHAHQQKSRCKLSCEFHVKRCSEQGAALQRLSGRVVEKCGHNFTGSVTDAASAASAPSPCPDLLQPAALREPWVSLAFCY